MNYKAKYGESSRLPKKRVVDVNAMGYATAPPAQPPYVQNTFAQDSGFNYAEAPQVNRVDPNQFNNVGASVNQPQQRNFAAPYYDPYSANQQQSFATSSIYNPNAQQTVPGGAPGGTSGVPGNFSMLQQPIVQDMALQYGQRLADQGKQLVESHFEKYVPVTRLKYYFAVDNNYVVKKLMLLLFPFAHKEWSLKYDQDNPVQPRYDLNAPDLYIPTMAYITYVVLAGLVMGTKNQFTPEQLGIISSSALAYSIFELIIYTITLYIANISTSLKTLDLFAFSGYKFVIIDLCILISIGFNRFGYYLTFFYSSFALFFFLLRTLKAKILRDGTTTATYDAYGNVQQESNQYDYTIGRKRKLYFLFLISCLQPVLTFFLSMHLIPSKTEVA